MSFDEMYDEVLHGEFRSQGRHQAKEAVVEPETEQVPSSGRGRHAATDATETETGLEGDEGPRGFQRYRTAALVGAGGMACAAAGAFLGGLGGYFTVSPAAAHPVASSTVTQDLPLAQAVGQAAHSSASAASAKGTAAVAAAKFGSASGGLTQGIAPFQTLTSQPLQNLPVVSLPGLPGTSTGTGGSTGGGTGTDGGTVGGGTGGGGTGTGCSSSSSDLGLTCILDSLTSALSNLGSLSGNPTNLLGGLMPTLTGVVTDVTGTLQNLDSLLPLASLPLPSGGGTTVLAGATNPSTGVPSTLGGAGSGQPSSIVSALAPVLNSVGALASGLTGSTTPTIPSLPLSGSSGGTTLPSLPITTPAGTTANPPTVTTPTSSSSGGSTTLNIPLPLPITVPTISIGGLSVGINSTDSKGGLTLTLP